MPEAYCLSISAMNAELFCVELPLSFWLPRLSSNLLESVSSPAGGGRAPSSSAFRLPSPSLSSSLSRLAASLLLPAVSAVADAALVSVEL